MAKNQEEKAEVGKKRDWKFLLILVLLAILLILAVGAGAYYIGVQAAGSTETQSTEGETKEKSSGFSFGSADYLGPLVELEDFVVNITDREQTRYLKVSITLEAADKKTKSEVENRLPQVRDTIIFQVSGKTYDQLRDLEGKKQLQAELIMSLNELLDKGRVQRLFFTEFVVQ
jgi:flagellar FliL protein